MRKILGVGLVLLSIACCLPAAAAEPPVSASETSAKAKRALDLSKLLQPRELVVESAMATLERDIPAALRGDEDVDAMEAEYPGIIDAMLAAAMPELRAQVEASMPSLWTAFAKLYESRLSLEEIEAMHSFFSGPTGQKLLIAQHRNFASEAMIKDVLENEDGTVSAAALQQGKQAAMAEAQRTLTPEDKAVLMELIKSPLLLKMQQLGPEVQRLTLELINAPDPEGEARIEALMTEAAEAFIARSGPG